MTTHSSLLAWRIPSTDEPGRLQSMGLQGVGHDWAINIYILLLVHGGCILRSWQKLPTWPCAFIPTLWCTLEPEERGVWCALALFMTKGGPSAPWPHFVLPLPPSGLGFASAPPEILAGDGASSFQCWAWSHCTSLPLALWLCCSRSSWVTPTEWGRT